jgi:hypothetical protein
MRGAPGGNVVRSGAFLGVFPAGTAPAGGSLALAETPASAAGFAVQAQERERQLTTSDRNSGDVFPGTG